MSSGPASRPWSTWACWLSRSKIMTSSAGPVDGRDGIWRHGRGLGGFPRLEWRWATVEGDAELIGPDHPHPEVDAEAVRQLRRDIFTAAGGTHDDWDTYDRVMAEERRAAVLITPRRIYTNPTG
jgi:hypothetical protein